MVSPGGRRWFYRIAGLVLWGLCGIAGRTMWRILGGGTRPFQDLAGSETAWLFLGGMFVWLLIYGVAPRPVRLYVLGHELTHVLGAWLSGGSARGLRVGVRGGRVMVTAHNVFVVLGPYFIPFYAVLLLLAYAFSSFFIAADHPADQWWMAGLGVCWGFHLTFTVSALSRPQSDIDEYGPFFSYGLIVLCNMSLLIIGVVWLATPTFETLGAVLIEESGVMAGWLRGLSVWLSPAFVTIKDGLQSFILKRM